MRSRAILDMRVEEKPQCPSGSEPHVCVLAGVAKIT